MAATRRLFFALWPDDALRAQIAEAARGVLNPCRGKQVPQSSYHITLAFLGDVPQERVDCVRDLGNAVRAAPFSFTLDTFGYFPKAHVAWLGASAFPDALTDLYNQLNGGLVHCGLVAESRPFHPHLTLLRKAVRGPEVTNASPVLWPVSDFVLVESVLSEEGSRYQVIEQWPLSPPAPVRG